MEVIPTPIQEFDAFLSKCLPGEEFLVPPDWVNRMHEIRVIADAKVRNRNARLRIWLQGEPLRFECKFWAFDREPPPRRKWLKKKKKT